MSTTAHRYLHGYSPAEQRRLHRQARVFEPLLHRDIAFPKRARVLDVGCGVGAQTAILIRRHPAIAVTGLDLSATQLAAARRFFRSHSPARPHDRVTFVKGDATAMPFPANSFEGAFFCWLLEHVPAPLPILREVRRVLKPGATLFLREVFNHSVYIRPLSPALEQYWKSYNDHQSRLGGNPNVGVELGNLLRAAAFDHISVIPEPIFFDRRTPALRRIWLDYWQELLLSAAPNLRTHRLVTPKLIAQMKREFTHLRRTPTAIFHFTPIFASARKPG